MAHDDTQNEPGAAPQSASSPAPRHNGWTPEKQAAFLRMLAATQSVSAAAKSVGMGRQSAYKLRARLNDGPFGAAWRLAVSGARSVLLEAALDRAVNGVEVPHYWQGQLVGTSRRYDERLTTALLMSGALGKSARAVPIAESEYAQHELSRLLNRIECGPDEWCDFQSEQGFAWGVDPDDEEGNEGEGEAGSGAGAGARTGEWADGNQAHPEPFPADTAYNP